MKLVHASAFAVLSLNAISSTAFAHSTLETQQAMIGSHYKGIVRVTHGCGEQATHTLRVMLPQEIVAAEPVPKTGWKLETKQGPYARPYDNQGRTMHEGVREIVWSGGNLPNEHYDEFVFTGTIAPAAEPGTIYVPVVQECAAGSERWVEIPSGSEPNARLKYPAPKLTLVQNAQKMAQAPSHTPAAVAEYTAGPLKITAPWTRATPKGAQVGGGYFKITNTGTQADRLVGGSVPIAGRLEVHEMSNEGGMMKMRHLAQGLEIKPGATVELKPGGYHAMFLQLKEPLIAGKPIKGTLVFEKAGTVEIEYSVAPAGAREMPASGGHGGGHSQH